MNSSSALHGVWVLRGLQEVNVKGADEIFARVLTQVKIVGVQTISHRLYSSSNTMAIDEYIDQVSTEMQSLCGVLYTASWMSPFWKLYRGSYSNPYRPSPQPQMRMEREKKAIVDEFDHLSASKTLRTVPKYNKEDLELFSS